MREGETGWSPEWRRSLRSCKSLRNHFGALEVGAIVGVDEAGQSSPGYKSTETNNKCISCHIRYDFQVHSLCAKAHENGHIRFDEGWLSCVALLQGEGASIVDPSHVEWRAGRHTGGWELSHLLVLCPCSDTSANSAAPADVASQSSSPEHMNSCTYMGQKKSRAPMAEGKMHR